MDTGKISLALVEELTAKDETVDFSQTVLNEETGRRYLVTVKNLTTPPTKVEKLFEAVLYPKATSVCKCCGK